MSPMSDRQGLFFSIGSYGTVDELALGSLPAATRPRRGFSGFAGLTATVHSSQQAGSAHCPAIAVCRRMAVSSAAYRAASTEADPKGRTPLMGQGI